VSTFIDWGVRVGDLERQQCVEKLGSVRFAAEKLGFAADAAQAAVLESKSKRGILNCTRQWGKSTVAAIKALHTAMETPEGVVIVASPSERQSGEFLHKASRMVRALGMKVRGDGKNDLSLLLQNGARIIGLPGVEGTVRGFSAVKLLVVDEAARVSDDVYKALRPMLAASDGDLWLLSTPFGRQGFFYETWAHGGAEWERISIPATECPRISRLYLEEERGQMGNAWFLQEYMCEFVDNGREMFESGKVREALGEVEALF
jgi:hypothetical protein